jgi:predicted 3-demethylubiquinone-9 3-methyltransferase (glyoxalase superfamily)
MPNTKIHPFLLFEGKAEEAINLYLSLFPGSQLVDLQRWGPNQPGKEHSVMKASFTIKDLTIMCTDSPAQHAVTFTPSVSLFVDCDSEDELNHLNTSLSEGGNIFMPIGNYGFSRSFTWISDRFGVSWQLNLA